MKIETIIIPSPTWYRGHRTTELPEHRTVNPDQETAQDNPGRQEHQDEQDRKEKQKKDGHIDVQV